MGELPKNWQFVALELIADSKNCCQVVVAPVMASVADVLESVRQLLSWLERKPFDRSDEYHGVRTTLIR